MSNILKVGIVILNYNTAEITKITIDSLIKAKHRVPYEICLIDNASSKPDVMVVENSFNEKILQNELTGSFIRNTTNLGFAGGNNVGISNFLNSPGISHVCLLNADVIVTDWWLDNLLALQVDAVGPVSNAVGNEQTVIPDYSVEKDFNAFDIVNTFAVNWCMKWKGSVSQTDFLGFFAVLFSRKLIETVGLLDTRFYPGSYEDDDYCIRIIDSGYKMYIARDVYLHHYGSGSFSKLALEDRISISDENKKRFENKWGRKWEDRTCKIVESSRLETVYMLNNISEGNKYLGYINACYAGIKDIVIRGVNHNVHLEEKVQGLQNDIKLLKETSRREALPHHAEMEISLKIILLIVKKKLFRKLGISKVKREVDRIVYDARYRLNVIRKRSHNLKTKIAPSGLKKLMLLIIKRWNVHKLLNFRKGSIGIFAPLFNEERLKDGYFRRVKAVDDMIGEKILKIYCCTEFHEKAYLSIKFLEDNRVYVAYNPDSLLQQIQIVTIVFITGRIYVHSVLQLMKMAFYLPFVEKVIDLHGAVPEEFRLHNDYLSGQFADEKEELAVRKAHVVITVTDSMKRYILQKHTNKVKGEIIIMPIFDDDVFVDAGKRESGRPYKNGKAVITYAGGVHKWQMIPLMQDVMVKVKEVVYRIFVPSPAQFWEIWGSRPMIDNMLVESKTPKELPSELDKCHYGFVLREEIEINAVACPTKLIEYIQHGIVPIMHSPKVGDFQKSGMNYISLEDLINSKLPGEERRLSMANENRQVLIKLRGVYDSGKRRLLEWIGSSEE